VSLLSRYNGSLGGRTKVRPVTAARTNNISIDILTLFQPPKSGVKVMYRSSLDAKGDLNSKSRLPGGSFQYASESILTSHSTWPLVAPSTAGVSSMGRPATPLATALFRNSGGSDGKSATLYCGLACCSAMDGTFLVFCVVVAVLVFFFSSFSMEGCGSVGLVLTGGTCWGVCRKAWAFSRMALAAFIKLCTP